MDHVMNIPSKDASTNGKEISVIIELKSNVDIMKIA
jgi:hypothetical protein